MIVSSKVRYATRAMMQLALHDNAGPMPARQIARQEGLSEKFLESILAQLKRAGLVESRKGKYGGYTLVRAARDITLLEIIRLFEPSLVIEDEDSGADVLTWRRIRTELEAALQQVTLSRAVRESFSGRKVLDYSI